MPTEVNPFEDCTTEQLRALEDLVTIVELQNRTMHSDSSAMDNHGRIANALMRLTNSDKRSTDRICLEITLMPLACSLPVLGIAMKSAKTRLQGTRIHDAIAAVEECHGRLDRLVRFILHTVQEEPVPDELRKAVCAEQFPGRDFFNDAEVMNALSKERDEFEGLFYQMRRQLETDLCLMRDAGIEP